MSMIPFERPGILALLQYLQYKSIYIDEIYPPQDNMAVNGVCWKYSGTWKPIYLVKYDNTLSFVKCFLLLM